MLFRRFFSKAFLSWEKFAKIASDIYIDYLRLKDNDS